MWKCKQCKGRLDDDHLVVKIGLLSNLRFCSEECQGEYAVDMASVDFKQEAKDRIRAERQIERDKLRREGRL